MPRSYGKAHEPQATFQINLTSKGLGGPLVKVHHRQKAN